VSEKGFENAVMVDQEGKVAEFASANLFAVINGEIVTPRHNNTFLNGITRQRVMGLAKNIGLSVNERRVEPQELEEASEIFNTGNFGKLMYVNKYGDRSLSKGPIYRALRSAYWDFSLTQSI
jgi:branched-chain amino acid aminotransferase